MGFTRKFLAALGVESDKVDEIISVHNEVLEHFKSENAELKEKVSNFDEIKSRLADTEKTLKETTEKLKTAETERDDLRAKHDTLRSEKEKLESEISAKETAVRKDKALSEMLRSKNYSDEAVKLIVNKGGYRDRIELDKDGKAKNIDDLFSDIQTDFSMLVPKESVSDGSPAKPPANSGGKNVTKDSIMAIKNTSERQRAIAENPELFGLKSI